MSLEKETLSSNSLFHFTQSAENLISILESGFAPRYCLENFAMFDFGFEGDNADNFKELAVPMVCFCDIPLSKVKHHLSLYGDYGIGLSKEWGNRNGVSPVLYVDSESETFKCIQYTISYLNETSRNVIKSVIEILKLEDTDFNDVNQILHQTLLKVLRLLRYTKPYSGKFWRQGAYIDNVRFYDEREWRYIPDIQPNEEGLYPWLPKDKYLNQVSKATNNRNVAQKYTLKIDPKDIRYIIVKEEEHILAIIESLEDLYGSDPQIIRRLSAKIITQQQIVEDF